MMMPVMYQADPSVGSRRVSALVKDRDWEGEEMKPGPEHRMKEGARRCSGGGAPSEEHLGYK